MGSEAHPIKQKAPVIHRGLLSTENPQSFVDIVNELGRNINTFNRSVGIPC